MNIRRMTLAAGAATGGVLAAGFLQTAVAFATTGEDPFTVFAGDVGSSESGTQLQALDGIVAQDDPAIATLLTTDINSTVPTTGLMAAPSGDNAFAELLPSTATTAQQTEATDLDDILANGYGSTAGVGATVAASLAQEASAAAAPDAFGFTAVPGTETPTSVNGIPPLFQEYTGVESFATAASGTGSTAVPGGEFEALVNNLTAPGGFSNQEIVVNTDLSATTTTTVPLDGSTYDIANFGNNYENIYSDVLTASSTAGAPDVSTVTDTLQTPLGNVDLTPYVDFMAALDPSLFANEAF